MEADVSFGGFMNKFALRKCLAALFLFLVGTLASYSQEEEPAILAIKKLRGQFSRDTTKPSEPVVSVSLYGTKARDMDLINLKSFKELRDLNLRSTSVTSAGLVHLKELKKLRELYLCDTNTSDKG